MPAHNLSTISIDTFDDVLSRYASSVPEKLQELDTLRYDIIPTKLAQRREEGEDGCLRKDEVEKLVEWKL